MMAIFELTSCFSFHFYIFFPFSYSNVLFLIILCVSSGFFYFNVLNKQQDKDKTRQTNNINTLYSLNVSKQTTHYVAQIFYLCCKAYLWVESVFFIIIILEWKVGNNNKQIHRTEESCTARGC